MGSYVIRAKLRNDTNKNISVDMKISKSTVKRIWTHWLKYNEPISIKKFGRKKKVTEEESEKIIIEPTFRTSNTFGLEFITNVLVLDYIGSIKWPITIKFYPICAICGMWD